MRLALEPPVLGRILLRGIGSKAQARDFPVGLGQAAIRLREKLLKVFPTVIAGSVPEKDRRLVRREGVTPLEIRPLTPFPVGASYKGNSCVSKLSAP